MPKARSYGNLPWTCFQKQSYSLLVDDFMHYIDFTFKANFESTKGGFNLREALSRHKDRFTSAGQTKLWFFFNNNQSIYANVDPYSLTLLYDHGIQERDNKFINLYGAIESTKTLIGENLFLGVDLFSATGKWMCNNMLQFSQNFSRLFWHHKAYTTHNQWFFNNYLTFDMNRNFFRQAAFLISLKNKGQISNDYSFRFQLASYNEMYSFRKKSIWSGNKVTLNWINSEKGKYARGVEFSSLLEELCSTNNLLKKIAAAFQINFPEKNTNFKLRISGDCSVAFALKQEIGSYGTYTWGTELSKIGSINRVRMTVQFDLNL